MNTDRLNKAWQSPILAAVEQPLAGGGAMAEEAFHQILWLERKRAERSGKPSLMLLIELRPRVPGNRDRETFEKIVSSLAATTRETDVVGWYQGDSVLGVVFTEVNGADEDSMLTAISERVRQSLGRSMRPEQMERLHVTFHCFSADAVDGSANRSAAREPRQFPRSGSQSEVRRLV
jgi:hypothetical protein